MDRATDVAVTIEDANGKIIRHLAAGVLGKNPPEPLQPNTLAQSLDWDGKDDFGKPAADGPFKVRVQLGMKAEFDRFLMHNPDGSGPISSVAVGPGGALYVFHRDGTVNGNMGGHKIKVYNRDGKHQKVLAPFPADIAAEKVKALGVFQTAEGDLVPHIHNWETLSFYPDNVGVRGRDMPEYSCPAVDSKGRVYWLVKGPALVAVDADGGIPYDTFLGPKLLPDIKDLRLAGRELPVLVGACPAWRSAPTTSTSTSRASRGRRRLQASARPLAVRLPRRCGQARPGGGLRRQARSSRARQKEPAHRAARPGRGQGIALRRRSAGQSRRGLQGSRTAPTSARSPSRTRKSSASTRPAARSTSAPTPARRRPT